MDVTRIRSLVILAVLSLVAAGCGSRSKQSAPPAPVCMIADVSFSNESLTITNTSGHTWKDLKASFTENGPEANSFEYIFGNNIIQPGATIILALKYFVREDGLRYDPAKYSARGIMIDTENEGGFYTTQDMARDARGMFVNACVANALPSKLPSK